MLNELVSMRVRVNAEEFFFAHCNTTQTFSKLSISRLRYSDLFLSPPPLRHQKTKMEQEWSRFALQQRFRKPYFKHFIVLQLSRGYNSTSLILTVSVSLHLSLYWSIYRWSLHNLHSSLALSLKVYDSNGNAIQLCPARSESNERFFWGGLSLAVCA